MQKIKTTRWPARNPNGDRLFTKFMFSAGQTFQIATGAQFVSMNVSFGGMQSIGLNFGATPGATQAGTAFRRYRIRGVKITLTAWPSTATPLVLYTNAGASVAHMLATPTISALPEQRWSRFRVCNLPSAGAKPTTLSSYYSVEKVWGVDEGTRVDHDFVGSTFNGSPSLWVDPAKSPVFQYGVFTMAGTPVLANTDVVLKASVLVYIELFSKTFAET